MVGSSKSIKFFCSYGGRIIPRYPDGKLRYHGGETRVLSVDASVSFSELLVKMGEMCGSPVNLRCQLPTEDLDSLVSIKSDEDLANLIEEYDYASSAASPQPSSHKIRAFISSPKTTKTVNSPPSSGASSPTKSPFNYLGGLPFRKPPAYPKPAGKNRYRYGNHGYKNGGHVYAMKAPGNSRKFSGESKNEFYFV